MSSQAAVQLRDVTKEFGSRPVLRDINLQVAEGTILCILGRSGSGKSVTLKLMAGLVRPDRGEVFIGDNEISELASRELMTIRRSMGFLFQYAALFDSISVGRNVAFPLERHTELDEAQIQERVERKLALVGLKGESEKMPAELSGGMRKRVGLARALALEPKILLVDEPSSGLDAITSTEIDELLEKLNREHGVTMVVVTHDVASARRIGREFAVLHQQTIVARGGLDEVESSENEVARRLITGNGGTR